MNMSECSGAAMLLTKGDSVQRKKRAYCDVALQEIRDEQQQSYYGKRVERNVAKVSLPKVGTLIKMTEVMQFVRAHAWDKPAKQGYILVPYPHSARSTWSMSGTSSRDEEKVYEVVGYTGDTTNPFNSSLKMIFRNVYPERCG